MEDSVKMDIVWMNHSGVDVQSQIFLYQSADHSEARLDWYLIPKGSYELYTGGDPVGPRFSLYLVDQVKSIEECSQKSATPSKHLLRINYLNTTVAPLNIWFQQKEDLKSWVDALKKALDLGRKHRKKLEKEHVSTLKKVDKDCDQTDENFYDTNNAKNTVAFQVDVDSTAASMRNGVVGDGTVVISSNHITLFCTAKNYIISWNYKHVRRFGYSSSSFLLEGGHKSGPKGEGLFMFSNCPGHNIRECINAKTNALNAKKHSNKFDCGDSDSGDYTEERMNQIYSDITQVHRKLDSNSKFPQTPETYASFNKSTQEIYQTDIPPKPRKPPASSLRVLPPSKPTHLHKTNASISKMSDVVQALSSKGEDPFVDTSEMSNEYSALSFQTTNSDQPHSGLSVTGNLYGEALFQQNGLQEYQNVDSTYSQVDYDKVKDNNKCPKVKAKKKK